MTYVHMHVHDLPRGQITPASLECEQEGIPRRLQLRREDSVPVHLTLLRSAGPVPSPKPAQITTITIVLKNITIWCTCLIDPFTKRQLSNLPPSELTLYPSCLHTTLASLLSQLLYRPHTVPHTPLMQTSTLPAFSRDPLAKRIVPLVQCWTAVVRGIYLSG